MNIRSFSSSHLLMYLKILYYVDEEVVQGVGGKRAPSDRENLQAGTRVKDCLRDSSIGTIFNSWYFFLSDCYCIGWKSYNNMVIRMMQ